jgi:hypothetical protein
MTRIILVAGFDYTFRGLSYRQLCKNRMDFLLAANEKTKEPLTFDIFDFPAGTLETHAVTYPGGKKSVDAEHEILQFTPVRRAHYEKRYKLGNGFGNAPIFFPKDGLRGFMPITSLYSHLLKIGDSKEGVRELSFFTYSWATAPAPLGSMDDRKRRIWPAVRLRGSKPTIEIITDSSRDPDDFDARTLDLSYPTLTVGDRQKLELAFTLEARCWMWGGDFRLSDDPFVTALIDALVQQRGYRATGLNDDVEFRFTTLRPAVKDWIELALNHRLADRKQFRMPLSWIKEVCCATMGRTYAQILARQVPMLSIFSPTPGGVPKLEPGRRPLLRIDSKDPKAKKRAEFFTNYLGMTPDPEGRGYLDYSTLTCPYP